MARPKFKFVGLSRDWLDVRVPLLAADAASWFMTVVDAEVELFKPPASSGYQAGIKSFEHINTGSVSLLSDHSTRKGWSLLSCTGGSAEWGWNVAAENFDVCQANRVDAALDFMCSETAFNRLLKDCRVVADTFNRPYHYIEGMSGRTFYFNWSAKTGLDATGNAKVGYYTGRVYEKGKQLGIDPDLRRMEVSAHPDKPVKKERVFRLNPEQILGSPNWSRALLDLIGYSDAVKPGRSSPYASAGPVSVDAKVAKRMSAISHMGEQYGEAARDLVRLVGEEEAMRIVMTALFRPVVVQDDGREITGPGLIRREAQQRWNDVFKDDLQRRMHDAGEGGKFYH